MKTFWTSFVSGAFVVLLVILGVRSALGDKSEALTPPSVAAKGSVEDLAAKLKEKEKSLQEKELRLSDWESRLKTQEERIKSRVEELRILTDRQKKNNEDLAARRKNIEDRLLATYETMSPKKAGDILSAMDDQLAVDVLLAMKAKKVAAILDKMDSSKAMILSTKIAERKPAAAPPEGKK